MSAPLERRRSPRPPGLSAGKPWDAPHWAYWIAALVLTAVVVWATWAAPAEPAEPRAWARFDNQCYYLPLPAANLGEPCQ